MSLEHQVHSVPWTGINASCARKAVLRGLYICPANSTEGVGYKTMAENLEAFDKIGCLPRRL